MGGATVIEVVSVIDAAPARVFGLELDVDVHADSLPGSRETATTTSSTWPRRRLGDRCRRTPAAMVTV